MNHIEFIERNIRTELVRLGYPEAIAQGGHGVESITISAALRQAGRALCSLTVCITQNSGPTKTQWLMKSQAKSNGQGNQQHHRCSEKQKAPAARTAEASQITIEF